MATRTSTRDLIDKIVDSLSLDELEDLLDYLNNKADPDTLSPEEEALVKEGKSAIARGEYVTLEELKGPALANNLRD